MSWESLFLPAAEIPPFLLAVVVLAFLLAQRAFMAAPILARAAADIRRRPLRVGESEEVVPKIDVRRFCNASICRRIETASSNDLSDKSMRCE